MVEKKQEFQNDLQVEFSEINVNMAKETSIAFEIDKKLKIVMGVGHSPQKNLFIQVWPMNGSQENKNLWLNSR